MEKREPKKGKGVPRETREENSIADLQRSLTKGLPKIRWDRLGAELESRGFFEAGMQRQVSIMAEAALALASDSHSRSLLVEALAASPTEKVRGTSAFVVSLLHSDDLSAQLRMLHYTGGLEGT